MNSSAQILFGNSVKGLVAISLTLIGPFGQAATLGRQNDTRNYLARFSLADKLKLYINNAHVFSRSSPDKSTSEHRRKRRNGSSY